MVCSASTPTFRGPPHHGTGQQASPRSGKPVVFPLAYLKSLWQTWAVSAVSGAHCCLSQSPGRRAASDEDSAGTTGQLSSAHSACARRPQGCHTPIGRKATAMNNPTPASERRLRSPPWEVLLLLSVAVPLSPHQPLPLTVFLSQHVCPIHCQWPVPFQSLVIHIWLRFSTRRTKAKQTLKAPPKFLRPPPPTSGG